MKIHECPKINIGIVSLLDMMRFYADLFVLTLSQIALIKDNMELLSGLPKSPSPSTHDRLDKAFDEMKGYCQGMGLLLSVMSIEEAEAYIAGNRHDLSATRIGSFIETIQGRIFDELHISHFFTIPKEKLAFYESPKEQFGQEVIDRFPGAIYDIEEAGKCLALSRGTACVFHLNRTMELGLRALGHSLNNPSLDPKTNPTWESILRKCDEELRKPLSQRSLEWQKDDQFFVNATANIRAVKDAWRNPTMHVKKKYTDEEATDIFIASRAFMRHLATKLKE